jgi:type IV pilus assembly protein PilA
MTLSSIKKLKQERGFTIVELLIVIIVIGILATLVLIAYNNVQGQARDTKRQADANSIREAAETYKTASNSGYYPDMTSGATFQTDIKLASNYSSGTVSVSVDPLVTGNLNPASGAPSGSNPNNITSAWCGTASPLDKTSATGIKFTYWSESKKAQQTVSTGTGC